MINKIKSFFFLFDLFWNFRVFITGKKWPFIYEIKFDN